MLIQKRPRRTLWIRDANSVRSAAASSAIGVGCGSAGIVKRWPSYDPLDGSGDDLVGQYADDELPRLGVVRLDRPFGGLQVCDV